MKKILVLLLALVLILCAGCGKEEPVPETTVPETTEATVPETTVPETTEATIPVPEVVYGLAEINRMPALVETLSRGEQLDIVDSYDDRHYVVLRPWGYGLVEKHLIRMEEEPAYESWTGYAEYDTKVYGSFRLTGEPVTTLGYNAAVEVIEDLGSCYYVQTADMEGYVAVRKISRYAHSSGGGGGYGFGGGGFSGGGMDGGDISLQFGAGVARLSEMVPQQGDVSGKATVLADGTEVIVGYYDSGDEIPVVAEEGFAESWEGMHTVYLDGLYAYVSEELTRMEGEEPFAQWDGYGNYNAVIYEDRWLQGIVQEKMDMNTKILVLYELDNCYFVDAEGVRGFMDKKEVSKYQFGGGGGSYDFGGYGGGGGGGEWSPPVL